MIVFDEHGGTYDHVPPPAAIPPERAVPAGQMGFRFDRLGVRLPSIAISPWIAERTVVSEPYRHTSLIRTMRKRWGLGQPLTARDADAPDIAPVLSREQPRAPEDWPDVAPQPVPEFEETLVPREAPLSDLAKAVFHAYLALMKALGQPVAEVDEESDLEGGEALEIVHETAGELFPGLRQE